MYWIGGKGYAVNLENVTSIDYEGEGEETIVTIWETGMGIPRFLEGLKAIAFLSYMEKLTTDVEEHFSDTR